jgi:ATP-dependent Clp protease ATP-binding subunit ClpA
VNAYVVLHVRESAGGPVVATPVPFVDLAYEAASLGAAMEGLRPVLAERLEALEPVDRLPFAVPPRATLVRVPVEIEVGGKGGEVVEIVVGVVAITRAARGRPVVVGYVPVLPNFESVGRDGDAERLAERLAPRVGKRLRSWTAASVLNADEPENSRLEVVEVELEEGRSRDDFDDDGGGGDGVLEELGVDLTLREGGRFDVREELVQRVLETLAASDRSSVLLVGPRDVGKTALVHELARRIAAGSAPSPLQGRRVWRVSANELIAGALYTGQWQERVQRLIEQARRTRAVVAMGDPVGIIDAGRWSRSDNNVSRYLRPFIEDGEITIVCECTVEQLEAARKQEPSFVDAFHRVDVLEPTRDEARAIAAAAAARLGQTASLAVEPEAIDAAVDLTGRLEPYRSFPGKAVRLLEDAIRERADGAERLDRAALTAAFSRRSGMPLELLSDAVPLRVADVRAHFESRVLGQSEAMTVLVDLIAVLKAGLNDPQKPLASFFFVGPTGIGKTESAKVLAEFMFGSRERLVRFDMGEYASADAVQRLIGTAWGSDEGELTRRVRQQPFCVVLLDEIEKAHSSVFDALLAAIGEGRLSDAAGRVADFRNAIVIMTSNLGATRIRSSPLGFGADGESETVGQRYVEEAEKFFRPEFFNRIDRVVVFHSLGVQTVRQIARRELDRLLVREGIVRRQLLVELDDAVIDTVASSGFNPRYGARPLQRAIERLVIQPLARLLIERRPQDGTFVRVHMVDGRIAVDIERVKEDKPRSTRRERRAPAEDATFTKSEHAAASFAEQLAADQASALADELRATVSDLIDTTHEPAFWDAAADARATLQRIYRLEQLLDRFDGLRERAAGLTELARRVRESHNRARLAEIAGALNEMDDQLIILRLELAAAAAGGEGNVAVVRVLPIGRAATWANQLLAMYVAWADRTARDATQGDDDGASVTISGPATLDLLAGETGLHRHIRRDGSEELARVIIEAPEATLGGESDDAGTVVRVYEEGKRRVVRDPRTDIRESHVIDVLTKGRIDAFLIAALRRSETIVGAP